MSCPPNVSRGQLAPSEPLTISTTGVKVLLYKDCKKNINRLMKLRKHHLHSSSHGAGASASGSSMAGNSIKCSSSAASQASSTARTQLKFLDRGPLSADEMCATATADAQDQQWLLDNITTLKVL